MTASDAAEINESNVPTTGQVPPADPPDVESLLVTEDVTIVPEGTGLQRRLDVGGAGWFGLLVLFSLVVAIGFRLAQLDIYTLGQREAEWAYDSWSLYLGHQLPNGSDLPVLAPFFVLLQALSFFLFGTTDAIARIAPALLGIGLVSLILILRPFLSRFAIAGMLTVAAVSPTLVFASRTSDPIMAVGFGSLLTFVSILRAGHASSSGTRTGWAVLTGAAVAITLGSGPEGVTALLALGIGLAFGAFGEPRGGIVATAIRTFFADRRSLMAMLLSLVGILIVLFTRGLSDVSAAEGFTRTFSEWGRMMTTQSTTTPIQFFLYGSLLYEILAVAFAIVAVTAGSSRSDAVSKVHTLQSSTFAGWFLAALLLQSLASGRSPEQLTVVTLPLVLLGGLGLGYTLERVPWGRLLHTSAGVFPLAVLGVVVGLVAALTLVARSSDPAQQNASFIDVALPVVFVLLIVVAPLVFFIAGGASDRVGLRQLGWSTLLVLAFVLGLYTISSSTGLAFHRANTGLEPAAQSTTTSGLRSFVNQTKRLSRDLTLTDPNNIDNTGSYGLKIAVSPEVEWPYTWYFRDFYQLSVVSPAGWSEADMVIAPTADGMEDAGFIVQTKNAFNRVPASFEEMNTGTIVSHLVNPGKWYQGIRFLLFRDIETNPAPIQNAVGYTFRLSNQLNPNLGPFDLTDDVGPGAGLGQLSSPTGIALSPDGQTIYVVDSGNLRIQRYSIDGAFIGAWDGSTDAALIFKTEFGQGPQGMVTDTNGLIYVADTWNHRIVVLDAQGTMVRELGQRGVITDTANSPDPNIDTGRFYGPRSVAVSDGEIYIVDTGNERVQVFAPDGTFLRAFGGWGSEDGKLMEPTGIAIGPDGNVYVGDSGNGRVSVFAKDGMFQRMIPVASWQGQSDLINNLAFGPDGLLYATVPGLGAIDIIDPTTGAIRYEGNGDSGKTLTRPIGIAVSADGTVYVTDVGSSEVVWFKPVIPPASEAIPVATPMASPETLPVESGPQLPVGTPVG